MKYLLYSLFACLSASSVRAEVAITPAKVPDSMSITFFSGQLGLQFRVHDPEKNTPPNWEKMGEKVSVVISPSKHNLVKIRKLNQTKEITFDLFDSLLVVSSEDWSYIKKEMDQFSFSVEASTKAINDHIVGWVCGGVNYFSNPLYFQTIKGAMYFGRVPEVGKAVVLVPLRNEPSPIILSPVITSDSVTFSVNVVDTLDSHKFEYQIIDAKGTETGWQPLAKKISNTIDFTKEFRIQVRGEDGEGAVEFSFIKNGKFEISAGSIEKWGKMPNLVLFVQGKGVLVGKPIEVVGWSINNTTLTARGTICILVEKGALVLKADQIYRVELKGKGRVVFEPYFGEAATKQSPPAVPREEPPSLTPSPPKQKTPLREGEFQAQFTAPPLAGLFFYRRLP